jgi:hypothetical protein
MRIIDFNGQALEVRGNRQEACSGKPGVRNDTSRIRDHATRPRFRVKDNRIIDVSGQTGGWWKVVTDAQGRIDLARSLRKAVQGRRAEIAKSSTASFA